MDPLELLKECCDKMLQEQLGVGEQWWHLPNRAFQGLTPWGKWTLDPVTVYLYLVNHTTGDYQ